MKNKLLSIKNISKTYYQEQAKIEAIDDVSFDVYEEDFISIVGPSGCGKSTLLNILTNMEEASNGTIKFYRDLRLGYMLQSEALLPWRNVLDNACLGLEIAGCKTKENVNYVIKLLKNYGLGDFLKQKPDELSGGMRQRLALIRTLALKPDILILDEPFSKLDYQSRLQVSNDVALILKQERKTAIMVTHDLEEAISMSSKVIVFSKRPCKIVNIYKIVKKQDLGPIENRKDDNFSKYYDAIWKDLAHEQ